MPSRDTGTGSVMEQMIVPALERGGYEVQSQVEVGKRPNGRRHYVDATASKNNELVLISLKWQETSGTVEQKVPFEVMCLADVVREGRANRAVLVLGGEGWTLRDYFISGKLEEHLKHAHLVKVVKLEAFIRMANRGLL